jgi:hypothetical protein
MRTSVKHSPNSPVTCAIEQCPPSPRRDRPARANQRVVPGHGAATPPRGKTLSRSRVGPARALTYTSRVDKLRRRPGEGEAGAVQSWACTARAFILFSLTGTLVFWHGSAQGDASGWFDHRDDSERPSLALFGVALIRNPSIPPVDRDCGNPRSHGPPWECRLRRSASSS